MGDDELSQICINPLFVWQGSRMLSAICQAWNCSKSQPTRAKFRFKLVRRQLYSVHFCAWLLCHGWCPPGPESRLWTLRGNQIRKVWLSAIWACLYKLVPSDHKKKSLIWSAEKGTKWWWGICTKVQNMFGISIPSSGRSRFPSSKPGDFNVACFENLQSRGKRLTSNCSKVQW